MACPSYRGVSIMNQSEMQMRLEYPTLVSHLEHNVQLGSFRSHLRLDLLQEVQAKAATASPEAAEDPAKPRVSMPHAHRQMKSPADSEHVQYQLGQ